MSGVGEDLDPAVASAALAKLRVFVESLDEDERAVVAALLAPAVAQAYAEEPEVVGFEAHDWLPTHLPEVLRDEVRTHGWRIEPQRGST
jgi:hypothetical protein